MKTKAPQTKVPVMKIETWSRGGVHFAKSLTLDWAKFLPGLGCVVNAEQSLNAA